MGRAESSSSEKMRGVLLLSLCVLGGLAKIRLYGGEFPHEGNILVNGGPVCDDEFTLTNADVACRELGYIGAVNFTMHSKYGTTLPIFAMDDVQCDGTEERLLDCPHTKHDNCGGHEAAGVVCDTSTSTNEILEYGEEAEVRIVPAEEEESYNDNCSLAIPLYFPLRLSETYYKRFRNNVMRDSNRAADHLVTWRPPPGHDTPGFRFWPTFRRPSEDGFDYKSAISGVFNTYSYYTDLFHSYIAAGDLTQDAEEFRGRSHRYRYRYYSPLSSIARAETGLDEFVSNLSEDRYRNRYQGIMKYWVRLFKVDTWPYLASCLYGAIKENQESSDLNQAITDLVSEDDFEKFNRYFKRYVGDISKSLKKALESEETIDMVQLIYELTKSEIRSIDYNKLQPTLYYLVLQLKTVLMKPDFNELYAALNQTDYFIEESVWMYGTGQWPEMTKFAENFLRRTVGSIIFWDRLTGQFITEMKTQIPDIMDELKDFLDIDIEDATNTIFEKLTSIMNMIADGDEASIRQVFEDIRGSKWDEILTSYIDIIATELNSCNLVVFLAPYLPSYEEFKSIVINNNFFQSIKTLLFKDWPQDEIYPPSIEAFIRRIYEIRSPIFNAIFGNKC